MMRLARDVGAGSAREQELRDFLGQFRFTGDMVHAGGRHAVAAARRRAWCWRCIVWQRPNLLLLDEPTNHLDLTTREALSMALNEFEGTRDAGQPRPRAAARGVRRVLAGRPTAASKPFDGDLDDYQRWLLEVSRARARGQQPPARPGAGAPARSGTARDTAPAAAAPTRAATTAPAQTAAGNRRDERKQQAQSRAQLANRTRPLRLEIQQIDSRLERLGVEKAGLESGLVAGTVAADEMAETARRLNHIAAETAVLEQRWLELHAEIEAFAASA